MVRKIIAVITILAISMFAFAGCGKKGIEGTWVLAEEYEADGSRVPDEELKEAGITERYEIKDSTVTYTLEMASLGSPLVMDLVLEDLGGNKYNFKLANSNVTFVSVVVQGNTMTYYAGEGENAMKMVFKRK